MSNYISQNINLTQAEKNEIYASAAILTNSFINPNLADGLVVGFDGVEHCVKFGILPDKYFNLGWAVDAG